VPRRVLPKGRAVTEQLTRIEADVTDHESGATFSFRTHDISKAVELIGSARNIPGTDAYGVLAEAAQWSRMTVGEFARFMVRGLGR
jgi:hypothetical protein